jgi:hypothetical protein
MTQNMEMHQCPSGIRTGDPLYHTAIAYHRYHHRALPNDYNSRRLHTVLSLEHDLSFCVSTRSGHWVEVRRELLSDEGHDQAFLIADYTFMLLREQKFDMANYSSQTCNLFRLFGRMLGENTKRVNSCTDHTFHCAAMWDTAVPFC